jgi:hypothetical protein
MFYCAKFKGIGKYAKLPESKVYCSIFSAILTYFAILRAYHSQATFHRSFKPFTRVYRIRWGHLLAPVYRQITNQDCCLILIVK